MIKGGNATVYVSNMDNAVDFYTNVLGLKLIVRVGDNWAEVDAGPGLVIGLHPQTPDTPAPGASGGIQVGLHVSIPIDEVVEKLRERGVKIDGVVDDEKSPIKLAHLTDPDGNGLYLWEMAEEPQATG